MFGEGEYGTGGWYPEKAEGDGGLGDAGLGEAMRPARWAADPRGLARRKREKPEDKADLSIDDCLRWCCW